MNPIRSNSLVPLLSLFNPRRFAMIAGIALLGALPASAAEKAFRYYQFKTTKLVGNGSNLMFSEFDFYHGGTKLNIRNKTGVGASIPCDATAGTLDPDSAEGPNKILDGLTSTKLFRSGGLLAGNEVVFDFGATLPHPIIDSYSFTSAEDSANFIRTPQSWLLSGSDDKITWTPVDSRIDAVTTLANVTLYGPFDIPETVPPLISSFAVRRTPLPGTSAVVLNGQSVTLDWTTSFSTEVQLLTPQVPEGTIVAANGSQAVTPPPNSTSPYTLLATKPDTTPAVSTALVRTVAGGSKTYQYVRYTITGRRGGGTNLVQVSEFEFYNGDATVTANKQTVLSASNPGGDNINTDQVADKMIDGNFSSKWLDTRMLPVIFDFGSAKTFDRYLFVTGGDAADRDPVQWKLEGSNNLTRWDLIEKIDFNYPTPEARNTSTLSIPLPGASLPAQIDFFTGNTATLINGDPLTLSWSTQGSATVTLDPYTGPTLPLYGSVTVHPTEDTTYTLTADPGSGGTPVTAMFSVIIIEDPGVDDIDYDDFSGAGVELVSKGSTTVTPPTNSLPNRLRITPETQGNSGSAWFIKKLSVTGGFEATFGMSLNQEHPNNFAPADGLAFVVQNAPSGTGEAGTGENGVSQNALNICFHSFGFAPDPASVVEIRSGTTVITRAVTYLKPGIDLYGIPGVDANGIPIATGGFPYTLGSLASDPPYQIRVVYTPHDLDVYLDGIAVVQNVNVDLAAIGAADAAGKSYFGFTARTGGNVQNSDITAWHVKLGNFSALPPFGMVKHLFRYTAGNPKPTSVDLVWNASAAPGYNIYSSEDLQTWDYAFAEGGVNGQIGVNVNIAFLLGDLPKAFFRVEQVPAN